MYLKMIAVEASKKATLPAGRVFRWDAHHVKELFLAMLPCKLTLDGSSKVQVTCGPRGEEPQYQQVLGTSNYFREDFDFQRYYQLMPPERDRMLLQALEESFLDITSKVDAGAEARDAISKTARKVRERDFDLKIQSKKLSRPTHCRNLTVNVHRNLNRQVGEVWSCEVTVGDDRVVYRDWIGETPHYLDLTDFYKSSEWEGNVFIIRNRLGKMVYQLNVMPFLPEV